MKVLKNKRGQKVIAGIMIGIMLIIVAVIFIEPLKEVTTLARNSDGLDCENSSITTGQKMGCVQVDVIPFYFIGLIFATAGTFITGKFLLSQV